MESVSSACRVLAAWSEHTGSFKPDPPPSPALPDPTSKRFLVGCFPCTANPENNPPLPPPPPLQPEAGGPPPSEGEAAGPGFLGRILSVFSSDPGPDPGPGIVEEEQLVPSPAPDWSSNPLSSGSMLADEKEAFEALSRLDSRDRLILSVVADVLHRRSEGLEEPVALTVLLAVAETRCALRGSDGGDATGCARARVLGPSARTRSLRLSNGWVHLLGLSAGADEEIAKELLEPLATTPYTCVTTEGKHMSVGSLKPQSGQSLVVRAMQVSTRWDLPAGRGVQAYPSCVSRDMLFGLAMDDALGIFAERDKQGPGTYPVFRPLASGHRDDSMVDGGTGLPKAERVLLEEGLGPPAKDSLPVAWSNLVFTATHAPGSTRNLALTTTAMNEIVACSTDAGPTDTRASVLVLPLD